MGPCICGERIGDPLGSSWVFDREQPFRVSEHDSRAMVPIRRYSKVVGEIQVHMR